MNNVLLSGVPNVYCCIGSVDFWGGFFWDHKCILWVLFYAREPSFLVLYPNHRNNLFFIKPQYIRLYQPLGPPLAHGHQNKHPYFSSGTFQPTQASNDTSPSTTSHLSVAHDSADHPFTPPYHFHRQAQSTFCFRNSQECQFSSWGSSSRSWQHVQHFNAWSRSTDSTTALPSAIMVNFSTTWTPGFIPSRFDFHHCYFPKYPSDPVAMRQTFSVPFVLSC